MCKLPPVPAAMLVLALVIAAAAASVSPAKPDGADQQPAFWTAKKIATSGHGHDDEGRLPLMGLTTCVTDCGAWMTTCWLGCYQPLVGGEVVKLSVCLLSCSNDATTCVSGCATMIA